MSEFTPWPRFIAVGINSALLLFGKLMRVKLKIVQKLFIPPCLIAGFIALAFGPNGLGWVPLSGETGTYAGILIAFIFGCLPFTSASSKGEKGSIGVMWSYSQAGMLLQWGLGGLLGLLLLNKIWNLNPGFGITMPTGFCGGHGSAAAVGQAFGQLGYDDILTLAMTAATFGIVAAVIIGLIIVKWGTRKGHPSYLSSYSDLPEELRTGLLPLDKRANMGVSTCSSISIDSLTFNLAVIAMIAAGGYGLSKLVAIFLPGFELPVFSCAFIVGILVKYIFDRLKVSTYTCRDTVSHLSGVFTDYLVAFGIASIKLSIVVEYLVPLAILLVTGLIATLGYVIYMAKLMMRDNWFEKAIFTWGW
ncbi:MAG: sodium:glutamate symporter, partial [Muribaculaceae bacterium]|nr:sodium:glutamate symporter [Muribaculaceae bacterium]